MMNGRPKKKRKNKMVLFKKKRENLIVMLDIKTKKKYDLIWQRRNIGNFLTSNALKYFKEVVVVYNRKKNNLSGLDIILFDSRFKLNPIKDNTDPDQFFYRYEKFLPQFIILIEGIFKTLKLKHQFTSIKHLDSKKEDVLLHYAEGIAENEGGTANFFGEGKEKGYSIKIGKGKKK